MKGVMSSLSDRKLDPYTVSEICYVLYSTGFGNRKGGQSLVYDLAESINDHYYENCNEKPIEWDKCEPCETETPRYKDSGCLVCGQ